MRGLKIMLGSGLLLSLLLIVMPAAAAQSASTTDDGSGIPLPLIALGVVILALLTRNIAGIGSRRAPAISDEFDEDEDDIQEAPPRRRGWGRAYDDKEADDTVDNVPPPRRRRGWGRAYDEKEDAENYLIERDELWESEGYLGEDDIDV